MKQANIKRSPKKHESASYCFNFIPTAIQNAGVNFLYFLIANNHSPLTCFLMRSPAWRITNALLPARFTAFFPGKYCPGST
jgi:hypothetical protein